MALSISIQYQLFKAPLINFNININFAIFDYQYFLINALCTSNVHYYKCNSQSTSKE